MDELEFHEQINSPVAELVKEIDELEATIVEQGIRIARLTEQMELLNVDSD